MFDPLFTQNEMKRAIIQDDNINNITWGLICYIMGIFVWKSYIVGIERMEI